MKRDTILTIRLPSAAGAMQEYAVREPKRFERPKRAFTRKALAAAHVVADPLSAKEPWLEGRLVITPHSAWLTPHSWEDTRRKSAETMRAALLTNKPQNVITPEMY